MVYLLFGIVGGLIGAFITMSGSELKRQAKNLWLEIHGKSPKDEDPFSSVFVPKLTGRLRRSEYAEIYYAPREPIYELEYPATKGRITQIKDYDSWESLCAGLKKHTKEHKDLPDLKITVYSAPAKELPQYHTTDETDIHRMVISFEEERKHEQVIRGV